jgi:hypothetical protein
MQTSFRLILAATLIAISTSSYGQATRTWVSGVGDDANPCSRTAPCKTFAGAISKTAAKGEINVLDPGGFGAVTITKSITIDGGGMLAGVLTSAANAINVNAGPTDAVILRGLDINGVGTATAGVKFNSGQSLTVEKCVIYGFTGNGIDATCSAAGRLIVDDCTIFRTGVGILLRPTSSVVASVRKTAVNLSTTGIRAEANGFATVSDSSFTSNSANGIVAISGGVINASHSISSQNAGGIYANAGTIRITDMLVVDNSAHGLLPMTANSILSFGDNKVAGNTPDNAPSSLLPLK